MSTIAESSKSRGLSRHFSITIAASEIDARVNARLSEAMNSVALPGFRRGKVPLKVMRKRYRKDVLGEAVQALVKSSVDTLLEQHRIKPANEPAVDLNNYSAGENEDLRMDVRVDCMPEIVHPNLEGVELERPVITPEPEAVDKALASMARQYRTTEEVTGKRKSRLGDLVLVDYEGTVDGAVFDGGQAEDFPIELGAGALIPGLEEQIIGAKVGESLSLKVTLPAGYPTEALGGKEAVFAVTVKSMRTFQEPPIDEDFAKSMGLDSLATLRESVAQQLTAEYSQAAQSRVKRVLLDMLSDHYDFELPPQMVEDEFQAIWAQVEKARAEGQLSAEEQTQDEATLKAEYQGIAERRIRLGLLLADVGQQHNIHITEQDTQRAIQTQARQMPGREKWLEEYYANNPAAMKRLVAPMFEDRVVEHILQKIKVKNVEMTMEAFLKSDPDLPENQASKPKLKPAKKAKVASKTKTAPKKAAPKKATPKKAAATKPRVASKGKKAASTKSTRGSS